MINKVISDYLKANKRLIVPQLGAFIHKEGNGIVFVPFLKKDDGVMSSLLLSEYGMDASEAETVMAEFVVAVKSGISEHGFYAINGIGTLKEDVNGALYLDTNVSNPVPARVQDTAPVQSQPVQPKPVVEPVQTQMPPKPQPQIVTQAVQPRPNVVTEPKAAPATPRPVMPQGQMPRQEARQQTRPVRQGRPSSNAQSIKTDRFMTIAIIAAVLALAAIIYGVIASKDVEPIDKMVMPATENVQDSLTNTK